MDDRVVKSIPFPETGRLMWSQFYDNETKTINLDLLDQHFQNEGRYVCISKFFPTLLWFII